MVISTYLQVIAGLKELDFYFIPGFDTSLKKFNVAQLFFAVDPQLIGWKKDGCGM